MALKNVLQLIVNKMIKKNISKLLICALFLTTFFLVNVSAEGCWIETSESTCESTEGNYALMRLSASTNAHGELISGTSYTNVLCCDFGTGNTACSETNKIIGLSSPTNAHAEEPKLNNYANDVCYEDLICAYKTSSCATDEIGILSLSSITNAHIGPYEGTGSYEVKICCESEVNTGFCEELTCGGQSFCSDYEFENECGCDSCDIAEGSELCEEGDICLCEWRASTGECFLNVETIELPQCGNNVIDYELGETCDGTNFGLITGCIDLGFAGGELGCYSSGNSQECTLDITKCEGGIAGGICGDEIIQSPNDEQVYENCDCGEDGVCNSAELNNKKCEDFGLSGEGLSCYPSTNSNGCTFDTTACEIGEGNNPSKIGKCSYDESTDDDCEDKFLTYSWNANWEWDEENIGQTPPCEEDYILEGGLCYYDPNGARAKCVDGSNTVPCPAQIQLPFFGSYSVVIIIFLIVSIYIFLKFKEKEKSSKKKRKKK